MTVFLRQGRLNEQSTRDAQASHGIAVILLDLVLSIVCQSVAANVWLETILPDHRLDGGYLR